MALRDLFGKAKSTAKKAGRDARRAEDYAGRVYDREIGGAVEAHKRGASEVGERFGRANMAVGEYAERSFGFDESGDDIQSPEMNLGLSDGNDDRNVPDAIGGGGGDRYENNPSFPFGGDSDPDEVILGASDMMGKSDDRNDDRLW